MEWAKRVELASLQGENDRALLAAMKEERNFLHTELYKNAFPRIAKLAEMHEQLVDNYKALLPIIDMKKRLESKVGKLQTEMTSAEKNHKEAVNRLMDDISRLEAKLEETTLEGKRKEMEAAQDCHKKVKEVEAKKEEELRQEQDKHKEELAKFRKENHDEQEHLRNIILKIRQSQSSKVMSSIDVASNKLQANRAQYEKQLEEKDAQLARLEAKLECVQELLQHQQQLSVVRDVATTSTSTPLASPSPPSPPPPAQSSPSLQPAPKSIRKKRTLAAKRNLYQLEEEDLQQSDSVDM